MIGKAERQELRAVVKQQFKVLRREVMQRESELLAEVDREITERYAEEDTTWERAVWRVEEAAREANRAANDIMRELHGDDWPTGHDKTLIGVAQVRMFRPASDRDAIRRQAVRRLDTRVQAANTRLERQEADLLAELAAGAIESDEARTFLARIPKVSELVPAVRLLELERSLNGDPPTERIP